MVKSYFATDVCNVYYSLLSG